MVSVHPYWLVIITEILMGPPKANSTVGAAKFEKIGFPFTKFQL
jgi:hypothetical protein